MNSWFANYPQWLVEEQRLISRKYPQFQIHQKLLKRGVLCYYGELIVRPPGGAKRHPVCIRYPSGTPFELPIVTPIEQLPQFVDGEPQTLPCPKKFDLRHQMPSGALCLFQRETRALEGGETLRITEVLRRAEKWFIGHHTGQWPPDSHESELEPHFKYFGEALLGDIFFSDRVRGHGQIFMVRDMRRIFHEGSTEDPPLIATVATSEQDGIISAIDARKGLEVICPWIGNEAWSVDGMQKLQADIQESSFLQLTTECGFWWELPSEPSPFSNGRGLLMELAKTTDDGDGWKLLTSALGTRLTIESHHIIGLKYPSRNGDSEWLLLKVSTPQKKLEGGAVLLSDDASKRIEFENSSVGIYRVNRAKRESLQLRNTSVVQPDINTKSIALIGLGALGSRVAELLAQAGIGSISLCDIDRLSIGNVARHIGGVKDFGDRKTEVVASRILNINPEIRIPVMEEGSASSFAVLDRLLGSVDLVVSTVADENVESLINHFAVSHGKTVLYGRALRRGTIGRIFLVRPRQDACKHCLGIYASRDTKKEKSQNIVAVSEREEDVLLHECGRPVIAASAVDLSFVASIIARKSLDYLENEDQTENHWIWAGQAAPDIDERLANPLSTLGELLEPDGACPVCRKKHISCVTISDEASKAIHCEVESTLTSETGGILIGYVDDGHVRILRATGPGPHAVKTATLFDRDVAFVQSELEKAKKDLGTEGQYLGEWHSHLEKDPEPSTIDICSMVGIANAENYTTSCPLLLIAGVDTEVGKVTKLKHWGFPSDGSMYAVDSQENN